MKAILTVIGKDRVGIISSVSTILSENDVNILDISQTIMQDLFTMMMVVDISNISIPFAQLSNELKEAGTNLGLEIRIQKKEIFDSMHRV